MKNAIGLIAVLFAVSMFYACSKDSNDNPTIASPTQLTAMLTSQPGSLTSTSGSSSGAGSFLATISPSSNVLSYTVTFSNITPTAITLDPTSASLTTSNSTYGASILLAGSFPSTSTSPGSGTTTSPGSGTTTTPGSGTTTSPGSGTSTLPGSGTTTTPGSGTTTIPGSGTTTSPGSGSSSVSITSPFSGTVTVAQSRLDSLRKGYYQINLRTLAAPNGGLSGTIILH